MTLIYADSQVKQVDINSYGEENPNYPSSTPGYGYGGTWNDVANMFAEVNEASLGLVKGTNLAKASKYLYIEFPDIELTTNQFLTTSSVVLNKRAVFSDGDPGGTDCYDLHARVMIFNGSSSKIYDSGDIKKGGYWAHSNTNYSYSCNAGFLFEAGSPYRVQFVIAAALPSDATENVIAYMKSAQLDYEIGFIDPPWPTGVGINGFKPYMITI